MKKFILIAVVLLVAVVGLTSYNGQPEVGNNRETKLIAQLKSGGETLAGQTTNPNPNPQGGDKKKLD